MSQLHYHQKNTLLDEVDSDTKRTVVPDNTDISFLTKKCYKIRRAEIIFQVSF